MACAAAAAASGFLPTPVSAEVSSHSRSSLSKAPAVHESLWGSPVVWEEDPEPLNRYIDTSTLLMRGGTDEATPTHASLHDNDFATTTTTTSKHSSSDKKKKSSKKKKRPGSSKKHKKEKKHTTTIDEEEEEAGSSAKDDETFSNEDGSTNTNIHSSSSSQPTSNPMVEEILGHEDYYDILGLPKGEDNPSAIKKAYRRRAVQTHPDKTGGDRRAFDKLAEAYDALLDDDKRALYDRYGKAGLDPTNGMGMGGGGGGMHSAEDLFRSFFGGGPPQQQQQARKQPSNRTLRYQLEVTLEELYQGKTRKVTVEAPQRNLYYHEDSSRKKQVEVAIPRGGHPGQNIVLSGEMDFDSRDGPPGDLIFQLHPRPHKVFSRKGHDLALEVKISFHEAICGCKRTFKHLDGRSITIESAKRHIASPPTSTASALDDEDYGDNDDEFLPRSDAANKMAAANIYIQTGDVQVLKGQGMRKNPQGTEFGDLYVQYSVELPKSGSTDSLTLSERMELGRLLEKLETNKSHKFRHPFNPKQSAASYTLEPASLTDFGRASGPIPNPLEDDHHHHHHDQEQQQQYAHHFPFGNGASQRQFFFSSSSGRSPFFGQENNFEDDPNVQCSQM